MTKYFDNIDDIMKILSKGMFEDLVGALENEIFEAKGEPWNLNTELGKFEFAKDVTAMANWRGGVILVGVVARARLNRLREEVVEQQRYFARIPRSRRPLYAHCWGMGVPSA